MTQSVICGKIDLYRSQIHAPVYYVTINGGIKMRSYTVRIIALICLLLIAVFTTACADGGSGTGGENTETGGNGTTEMTTSDTLHEIVLDVAGADELVFVPLDNGSGYSVAGIAAGLKARAVEIPDTYEGKPVVAISEYAFYTLDKLERVSIPDTVKVIGDYAFESCVDLVEVTLSDSLEFLGVGAFDGCDALRLNEYGGALYIGGSENNHIILVSATDHNIDVCEVVDGTRFIVEYAFAGCTELEYVTFPESLRCVGENAFLECYDLEFNKSDGALYLGNDSNPYLALIAVDNVSISEFGIEQGARIIASYAFDGCSSLNRVSIPETLAIICPSAFVGCDSLNEIHVHGSDKFNAVNTGSVTVTVRDSFSVDSKNAQKLTQTYSGCTVVLTH